MAQQQRFLVHVEGTKDKRSAWRKASDAYRKLGYRLTTDSARAQYEETDNGLKVLISDVYLFEQFGFADYFRYAVRKIRTAINVHIRKKPIVVIRVSDTGTATVLSA